MGQQEADVNTEVTPETINGLVNAWLWVADTVATYGPGLLAAGIACAGWWVRCKAVDYRERRRTVAALRRQLADERRQMAALSAAIDNAPLIPTRPGHDTAALDTCNAILRATQTREETDQP